MTRALIYRSNYQWRFVLALAAAVSFHLAAIGFARSGKITAPLPAGTNFPDVDITDPPGPESPTIDEAPMPAAPQLEQTFWEETPAREPVRKQVARITPIAKPRTNLLPGSVNLSAAKVAALSAPRPEYPYEA